MIASAPPAVGFVCPRCRGPLGELSDAYRCSACRADYPVVVGIPDFRVAPDPWIGLEDDRDKARRLEALTAGMSFGAAVGAYWDITPGTPRPLAARFTDHVLGAERRTREWLAELPRAERLPDGPWLDLGCGTADLSAAAEGATVVGIDVALRWLVVARKRLGPEASGRLVCCNAEHLPFPDRSFARVASLGMLEHCRDERPVLREAVRVLRSGGDFHARTTNRFTLLPEPHVGVWGVGFLPRRWADGYVRIRSGSRYLHHRPLSRRELRSGLRGAGLARAGCAAACLLASDRERLGRLGRRAASLYAVLTRRPVAGDALAAVSPILEAWGVKP